MAQIIDATKQFTCRHEFIALPYGFACYKCQHTRSELELDSRKALIFFPVKSQNFDISAAAAH